MTSAVVNPRPWEVVVSEGRNDAAVAAAMKLVDRPGGGPARGKLVFPDGDFHLTKPIIDSPPGNTKTLEGLTVEGRGKRVTTIHWDARGRTAIQAIKRLRFFTLRGLSVVSPDPANTFCYAFSDVAGGGFNQRWLWEDVEFRGRWLRVLALDGDADANLNSEMTFNRVETATDSDFAAAFLECGAIDGKADNQEHQFLNYWFRDCNLTLKAGTALRFNRGGSVSVENGSWSAVGKDGNITWFHMPNPAYNNRSSAQLAVRRVRFEPKGPGHRVIDCGWGTGSVVFEDCCDLSSVQNTDSYGYNLHRYAGGRPWGSGEMPAVYYVRHQGAGYHLYEGDPVKGGGFVYEGSYFYRGNSGQQAPAVSGDGAALRWAKGAPRYAFQHCHNVAPTANY
jgi:hypothetical protein